MLFFRVTFRIVAIIAYHATASHTTVLATTMRISPTAAHYRIVGNTPPSSNTESDIESDIACITDSIALNERIAANSIQQDSGGGGEEPQQEIEMMELICTTNGGNTYETSLSRGCTDVTINLVACMDSLCSDGFAKEFLEDNFSKALGDKRTDGCVLITRFVSSEISSSFATRTTAGNILVTGSLFLLVIGLLT